MSSLTPWQVEPAVLSDNSADGLLVFSLIADVQPQGRGLAASIP